MLTITTANLTEHQLREVFAVKGEVTDCKIMRTKCVCCATILDSFIREGRSRKLGFVGFATPEAAKSAVKYFNKSFIQTSRLQVELALPVSFGVCFTCLMRASSAWKFKPASTVEQILGR